LFLPSSFSSYDVAVSYFALANPNAKRMLLTGLGLWARLLLEPTILIGLLWDLVNWCSSSSWIGPGSTAYPTEGAAKER
jgi:hypothetical protein